MAKKKITKEINSFATIIMIYFMKTSNEGGTMKPKKTSQL